MFSQSCGYGVPYYTFKGHRTKLLDLSDKAEREERAAGGCHTNDGLKAYWALENLKSIDGLDGLSAAHKSDAIPQSVYNKTQKGDGMVQDGVTLIGAYWSSGGAKFVAGLSLGLMISASYARWGGIV